MILALLVMAVGLRIIEAPLGRDAYLPVPEDNTRTREKAALGADTDQSRLRRLALLGRARANP